jgi:hypothetical protein
MATTMHILKLKKIKMSLFLFQLQQSITSTDTSWVDFMKKATIVNLYGIYSQLNQTIHCMASEDTKNITLVLMYQEIVIPTLHPK